MGAKVTEESDVASANAYSWILVTELGMNTEVMSGAPSNAKSLISVTPLGIFTAPMHDEFPSTIKATMVNVPLVPHAKVPESLPANVAVMTPEFAALVTEDAPSTVKKFAGTPTKVYPEFAVSVIVAV